MSVTWSCSRLSRRTDWPRATLAIWSLGSVRYSSAPVKSVLRLKQLHDQVTDMKRNLEQRVADQLGEIERMSGLKRFLAPQIAELVLSSGGEKLLDSHRKDVTIVFCDLRGFTAFAETAEPEEVMTVLREYHDGLAGIINAFEGTLERFAGDGLMVLFNDPMS